MNFPREKMKTLEMKIEKLKRDLEIKTLVFLVFFSEDEVFYLFEI